MLGGFVNTATEFYWVRFFRGIAEAGFFPGVLVYLTYWYRQQDRGKAVAMFMSAIPASNMLGAAVAAGLMRLDWFGMRGWRWLLILEGFPAIVAGIAAFFYLTNRPKDADGFGTMNASGSSASSRAIPSARKRKRSWVSSKPCGTLR